MGRPLLADPELPQGPGRPEDDIRKCIACNQGCMDRMLAQQDVLLGNPLCSYEREREIKEAAQRKSDGDGGRPAGIGGKGCRPALSRCSAIRTSKSSGGKVDWLPCYPGKQKWKPAALLSGQLKKLSVKTVTERAADFAVWRRLRRSR